jgi:hypothetical protein
MAETDGSIAISIGFKLDELKKSTEAVMAEVQKLTVKFKEQGEAAGKTYVQGVGKGIAQINGKLNDFVNAMKSISPKMGEIGEKIASQFSKPLLSAIPKIAQAFSSMLPVIGIIAGAIALFGKAVSVVAKGHKEFNDNLKAAATAEILLSSNTDKANRNLTVQKELVKYLSQEYGEEKNKLRQLEDALNEWERNFIISHKLMTEAEYDLITAENTQLRNAQKLGKVNNELTKAAVNYDLALKNIATATKNGAVTAEEADKRKLESAETYMQRLLELRTITAQLAGGGENSEDVAKYDEEIAGLITLRDSIKATVEEQEKLNAILKQREDATADYEDQLKNIAAMENAMSGTKEQTAAAEKRANLDRQSANEAYLSQLIQIEQKLLSAKEIDQKSLNTIRQKIKLQSDLLKEQQTQNKEPDKEAADITKRKQIMEQYYSSLRESEAQKQTDILSGMRLQDAEEKQLKTINDATQRTYTSLIALGKEYSYTAKIAPKWAAELAKVEGKVTDIGAALAALKAEDDRKQREEEIAEILKAQTETIEEQALAEGLATGAIESQIDYENRLFTMQRERARAEQKASLEKRGFTESEVKTVLDGFDAETKAMKDAKDAANRADKSLSTFFSSDKWNQGMQMATAAVQAFTDIASAITQAQRAAVESQIEDIDKMLDAELERIEEMRQRALEEAGFAEATTEESLQAKLDAAVEAGDQILAYEYQRRLEEKAINDRFDAQAKAAEEKAAKEKAQLEYKAAKGAWELSLAQAGTNLAMALLNAVEQGAAWPVPMGGPIVGIPLFTGLTAAAGTVQIALIAGNPPKPPTFEDGGLVPGSSFSGDNVLARVNSGERILTMENQEFMLAAAGAAGGERVITVVVPVYLDSHQIAEVVAEEINTARTMIDERGIRWR